MATVYRCAECRADLNLSTAHLFPPDAYFEAGNKGTLSFSWVDDSKLRFSKEDKIRPFFETVNYWGIQRKRTRIQCDSCGRLLGYVYDDGPPLMQGNGQLGFGPSQAIPRCPSSFMYRYSQTLFNKEAWDAVLLPPWRTGNRTMVHFLDLQAFIVRARVLKLYRQALRTARRTPIHSRDELRQTIRQEMEKNRHCEDRQKIRFLISEGLQRLKGLDEMLDMMGHS